MRVRLIQDDDGHWYLIRCSDEDDFYKWVANPSGSDVRQDFENAQVDGPHSVIITGYEKI